MLRGFLGNLIFAIIARMLCGNHLNEDGDYISVGSLGNMLCRSGVRILGNISFYQDALHLSRVH